MSSFKKIKKASKYADCKNSGKESLLKYYGVKTERWGCLDFVRLNEYNIYCVIVSIPKITVIGGYEMKYLSVTETAERWGISTRRIQILCNEDRIPGAIRIGRTWAIPDDEPKPADARIKSGK